MADFNGKMKAITFSYDDGVTQDIYLIELLNKYNLKCTFNLNSELLGKNGTLDCGGKKISHYCNYHFGEEHSNALTDIILRLEDTLSRGTYSSNGERCDYPTEIPDSLYTYDIVNKDLVETLADEFLTIHQNISDDVKENWRYQQIYSRVIGDATLLGNKGIPSEKSDEIYSKLVEIYHAENAYYFVSPITRESIMKNRGRELLL